MSPREKICHRCPFHYASYVLKGKKDDIIWWLFRISSRGARVTMKFTSSELQLKVKSEINLENLSCAFKDDEFFVLTNLLHERSLRHPLIRKTLNLKCFAFVYYYYWTICGLLMTITTTTMLKVLKRFIIFIS